MDARTRVRMAAAGVALSLVLAQAGPRASAAFAETVTVGADTMPAVTAVAAAEAPPSLDASPAITATDTAAAQDAASATLATATAPTGTPEAPAPVTTVPVPIKPGAVTPMIVSGSYGSLWLPIHEQERSYWCGPATCQIVTHYFGRLCSQSTFASFMGTTTDGTAFYKVAYALSNYGGRAYYYYGGLSSGAVTTRVSDSISGHSQPLVADVTITPGIWNQYRFIHSGHILPVEGYDWRYSTIRVCDPYNEARWKLGGGQTLGHVTHTLGALLSGISKHPQHAVVAAP